MHTGAGSETTEATRKRKRRYVYAHMPLMGHMCITPNPGGVRCSTRRVHTGAGSETTEATRKRRYVNACPRWGHAYDNPGWGCHIGLGDLKVSPNRLKKKKNLMVTVWGCDVMPSERIRETKGSPQFWPKEVVR